jgi:phosphatidylglycerophosphatase A
MNPDTASATAPTPFRSPVQFLAFGFGSGLSPIAPGTAGTLAAVPLYLALSQLSLPLFSCVLLLAAGAGVWICGTASRQLGTHDHPGIVWDEFVGFWLAMWALPPAWPWVIAGFLLFRLFDILKPWPVGFLDRRVGGGLGIMLDDLAAGLMACGCLHLVRWYLTTAGAA